MSLVRTQKQIPTKSKHVLNTLVERANSYEPVSPIHLHLDAIEASAWMNDFNEVPWFRVTSIAAGRIMELLAERWSPRYGKLYHSFSSKLRLQWDAASPEEKENILESCSRWGPDSFDRLMQPGAKPDWQKTGCNPDIAPMHIYKLLFGMAADTNFLVEDRFNAWFLDMGTAALAMHAWAWTDRYCTMGGLITDEMLYWGAFDEIFFSEDPLESEGWGIKDAMTYCQADWQEDSFGAFCKAREIYRELVNDGGLSAKEIMSVAMSARRRYPLIYRA